MAVHRDFIKAWRDWQHFPPVRVGTKRYAKDHVIHAILLDLDHMASGVYGFGIEVIAGKIGYIPKRAQEELQTLMRWERELAEALISIDDRSEIERGINAMQKLLIEMTKIE